MSSDRAPGLGRHRLYWKIWLAILATVVLFALLATAAWRLIGERPHPPNVTGFAELASEVLPPPQAPRAEQQAALDRWQRRLGADLALYGRDGMPCSRQRATTSSPCRGGRVNLNTT